MVTQNALPPPGTIGLTAISGTVGRLIHFGQWLETQPLRRWFSKDDLPRLEHAFILLPGGMILEAEPGGARIVPLRYTNVFWCTSIYKLLPPGIMAEQFLGMARTYRDVGYSFLDYLSLTAHRLGLRNKELEAYIRDTGHMICSQLDDDFYERFNAQVFTDGRYAGDVSPMDLYLRERELRKAEQTA